MMRKLTHACLVFLLFAVALSGTQGMALAGGRLALVIGNAAYQYAPALATPANDAADMAQHLRAIGFDVIEQRDATREAMAQAIHAFSGRLRAADVVLFFYAGHALQMNGANYLLPVDAKIENSADVRFSTIELGDIQKEMEGSGRSRVLILDACRPNPFADKLSADSHTAVTPGLARIDAAAPGTLVVYAAQPNSIGQEGTARNAPLTAALLAHLDKPDLGLAQLVSNVRGDVLRATGHRQTPWDMSSLAGDVPLLGAQVSASANPATPNPATPNPAMPNPASPSPSSARAPPTGSEKSYPQATPQNAAAAAVPNQPEPVMPKPSPAPTNDCDRLAALRVPVFDANATHEAEKIDWEKAAQACESMVRLHPGEIRFEYQLGRAYDNLKNYQQALHHYQIAADANFAEAQNDLGVSYYRGDGVVRNYHTAFTFIDAAAANGSARAMANLSALYADGKGVKKNDAKSLELAEQAVEAGNPFALLVIGNHYFNGAGVEKDFKMAAQYYQQAGDLGNGYALKTLANLYANGYLGPADLAKAGELRFRAARVDPTSLDPAPLPTYRPPSAGRRVTTYRRRRYIVYRRFFGFGGCVYVCF